MTARKTPAGPAWVGAAAVVVAAIVALHALERVAVGDAHARQFAPRSDLTRSGP
ncbi:hypothetical protein PQJ75_26740 [Rhodoplanes sp. TEM]|uniref:Uncharacterized protein n=1 Tax=Rhodoplanes tepidamans TaxID=200616 RepID=A0ABT5J3J4_RHOTP|nr:MULTISPECIES: hypothetical protein [Rhodoplanes]MDC7784208.1 hypothetical protein [Rhodoplanes tepidamans]MDC7987348.1 hypothetical protein [Rhodoplanes sp. TEM]MDQ0356694.1 hypothetical protein [Rhodoplanes tepidamans]